MKTIMEEWAKIAEATKQLEKDMGEAGMEITLPVTCECHGN